MKNLRAEYQNLAAFERYSASRLVCNCRESKHGRCYAYRGLAPTLVSAEMHRKAERISRLAIAKAFLAEAGKQSPILA